MLRATSTPGAVRALGQQHAPAGKTDADTDETTLFNLLIPAGTIGPNDSLRVSLAASVPGNTVVKTLRWRIGGVQVATYSASAGTLFGARLSWVVANRNSVSVQLAEPSVSFSGLGAPNGAAGHTITAVDFSQDQTLTVTGQHGTAGTGSNVITLESVLVEHIRGV
ncbi:hypothetical protein [Azospirillum soli]|uniref:hypothetical protein n=1 Tax=Azospirillum soli TaxID=1304799 RepID=UPI001AE2D59B|nr:hypothetical protein [Azospirillum soli]MBP2311895.1 hypothetical protein [Azospirillum soli]